MIFSAILLIPIDYLIYTVYKKDMMTMISFQNFKIDFASTLEKSIQIFHKYAMSLVPNCVFIKNSIE